MSDIDAPIEVVKSAAAQQIKGQLRMVLAALAGALVSRNIIPAGIVDDTLLNAIVAIIFYGAASYWTGFRIWLQHSRLWKLALSPRVPNDLIRVKPDEPA